MSPVSPVFPVSPVSPAYPVSPVAPVPLVHPPASGAFFFRFSVAPTAVSRQSLRIMWTVPMQLNTRPYYITQYEAIPITIGQYNNLTKRPVVLRTSFSFFCLPLFFLRLLIFSLLWPIKASSSFLNDIYLFQFLSLLPTSCTDASELP